MQQLGRQAAPLSLGGQRGPLGRSKASGWAVLCRLLGPGSLDGRDTRLDSADLSPPPWAWAARSSWTAGRQRCWWHPAVPTLQMRKPETAPASKSGRMRPPAARPPPLLRPAPPRGPHAAQAEARAAVASVAPASTVPPRQLAAPLQHLKPAPASTPGSPETGDRWSGCG